MWVLAYLGSPLIVGALMGAAFARGYWSSIAVAALGLGLGFGVVLATYYTSPTTYNGCDECENYLGRWWEPSYVIPLVLIAYLPWLFGIAVGVGVRGLVRRVRETAETRP
jgi:hypothetical protein